MTNAKNKNDKSNAERKIETLVADALCVADVARDVSNDLKIVLDPKRARAALRKSPKIYAPFRNKTFTRESALYKQCYAFLADIAKRRAPVTE